MYIRMFMFRLIILLPSLELTEEEMKQEEKEEKAEERSV